MSVNNILKIILLILNGWDRYVKGKSKKAYNRRINAIKADPSAEWDRKFKRVSDKSSETSAADELSSDNTDPTSNSDTK